MSILDTNVTVLNVNKETIDKPFEVGYRGDHNAYKLVFSDLVGDGYSVLFWKPMSKPCIAFPLVNNEWLLGNEVLSTSGTLYCQVVKKDESNNFIKHSQVFMLSVNESAPCTQQAFEEVPPNFKIAYDEMVAITKKVNEALTSGKFNGLSAYELAVKNGFKGTEAEWIESLKYWNSPEFTRLAEQVRADKSHVDTVVAEFDKKANQANTDFDTKVNTANTEFDKKVANANSAFDKKVTDADTNFTNKVNKANADLDTKVTQINSDLNAKETTINQALDTKIDGANSVIDAKVQESATSAENAKQSELKAKASADSIGGLVDAFKIDTSAQGRIVVANDSTERTINGLKVFGESMQVQSTGINLFNQEELLNVDSPNYDKSQNGSGIWFYKVQVKGPVVVSIATTTTTNLYLAVSNTPNISGVVGWLVHKSSANTNGYVIVNSPQENTIWLGVNNNLSSIKQMLSACEGIMICDGTANKPFEPFTDGKVSPSTEAPQPIISKVINNIVLTGKNLVNIPPIIKGTPPTTINCNIVAPVTLNVEILANDNNNENKLFTFLNKNGYEHNINASKLKSKDMNYLRVFASIDNPIVSITYYSYDINDGAYDRIMVAYGDTIQPYEPYKEPQVVTLSKPIDLKGVPVSNGNNVTIDGKPYCSYEISKKGNSYVITRNIERIDLKSLTFTRMERNNSVGGYYYQAVLSKAPISKLSTDGSNYCNIAKIGNPYNKKGDIFFCTYDYKGNFVRIGFADDALDTPEKVHDFLNGLSEAYIEYATVDTTFEPLPEADQQALKALKSNYPTTVVTNNDNAFMQLDYVADTKNYIDNRLSEIKTALIASKGV